MNFDIEEPEDCLDPTLTDIRIQELIRPSNLFKSTEELIRFINVDDVFDRPTQIESLKNMLELLEEDEMFEWCSIVKNKIIELQCK